MQCKSTFWNDEAFQKQLAMYYSFIAHLSLMIDLWAKGHDIINALFALVFSFKNKAKHTHTHTHAG